MQDEYSNREIDALFKVIDSKLDTIHTQTSKTNGRVTALENWQNFIKGGLAILTVLIVPILIYALKQILSL